MTYKILLLWLFSLTYTSSFIIINPKFHNVAQQSSTLNKKFITTTINRSNSFINGNTPKRYKLSKGLTSATTKPNILGNVITVPPTFATVLGSFLHGGAYGSKGLFVQASMVNIFIATISSGVFKQKMLTPQGLLHGTALGIGLWSFLGLPGWLVCVSYLLLGSLATKIGMNEKQVL